MLSMADIVMPRVLAMQQIRSFGELLNGRSGSCRTKKRPPWPSAAMIQAG
jgi:hypothetical protein